MDPYGELYRNFRWDVPEFFNFGTAIDALAAEPDQTALLWEDHEGNRARLTFADIREQSNRIANVLVGLGVRRGDRVIVALGRVTLWQAAYVGTLKAGAIVVPCGTALGEKDIVERAHHTGASAIIATVKNAELIGDLRNRCSTLRHYLITGSPRPGWQGLHASMLKASPDFTPVRARAADSAICCYSCGTTSAPKAILHSHAYTWCLRHLASQWLDVRPGELHWTTFETDEAEAAYGSLFGPWMNSAPIFMYGGPVDPQKELALLARYPIATLCASPTEYLIMLERDSGGGLRALRHCTSAGEPLDGETFAAWRDRFGLRIHEGYGQAETALAVANLPGMEVRPGSMGRPFPGYDVRILDAEGREASDGETGELAIRVRPERPPPLFLHYWKDAEKSAAAFHGDHYFTGDRASRDADGYLWFAGRGDAPAK